MSRFTCAIPIDPKGYHWVNERDYAPEDGQHYEQSLMLYGKSEDEVQREWREEGSAGLPGETYNPFVVEPALFRIFARLDGSPEAILQFAMKYGSIRSTLDVIEDEEGGSLWHWRSEHAVMAASVIMADEYIHPRSSRRLSAQTIIDFLDENRRSPELLAGISLKSNSISLDVVAHNLLDAMHLQLLESICERKHYRECDFCRKPFEISPQVNRSDRLFCSDNCRVKAYHRRKRQAIEMRAAGRHLREIVKVTESDMDTVKKWLKAGDERKKGPKR